MNEFDPNLKEAMKEITEILKRRDIAGAITLVSPSYAEYYYHIETSWSCATFETNKNVRFKATEAEYGSVEKRNEAIGQTLHIFLQIRDIGAQSAHAFDLLAEQIEHKTNMFISHALYQKPKKDR